jgi:hypothetical protein
MFLRPLLVMYLLLWQSNSAACAANTSSPKTYRLLQKSHVAGDLEVLVGAEGIRITKTKLGIVFVSKKPDWIVYEFNALTRRYFSGGKLFVSGALFMQLSSAMGGVLLSTAPVRKIKPGVLMGLPSVEYASDKQYDASQRRLYHSQQAPAGVAASVDYITAAPSLCPPEAAYILAHLAAVPEVGCLPLQANYTSVAGARFNFLETNSAQPTPSKSADFDLPVGFTKVDREGLLVQSQEDEKGLMLLFDTKYGMIKNKKH